MKTFQLLLIFMLFCVFSTSYATENGNFLSKFRNKDIFSNPKLLQQLLAGTSKKEVLEIFEINQILRKKYSYRGQFFLRSPLTGVGKKDYFDLLKMLKVVLKVISYPVWLGNVENIRIVSEGMSEFSNKKKGQPILSISKNESLRQLYHLFSSSPKGEETYKWILKLDQYDEKHIANSFKGYAPFFNFIVGHICQRFPKQQNNLVPENMGVSHGLFYDVKGDLPFPSKIEKPEIKKVSRPHKRASESERFELIQRIEFKKRQLTLKVNVNYIETIGGEYVLQSSQYFLKNSNASYLDQEVFRLSLDSYCKLNRAVVGHYNSTHQLQKKIKIDDLGKIRKTVYVNRRIRSLEDIYKDHPLHNKSWEQIQNIAGRTDRVLVAVLDSGIDYNHPLLAYKIPRRNYLPGNEYFLLEDDPFFEKYQGVYPQNYLNKIKSDDQVGWDFDQHDNEPYDYYDYLFNMFGNYDHGTHVAGIVTKDTDDIALLPVRFPKKNMDYFAVAVDYAVSRGAKVINMSFGSADKKEWKYLQQAIKKNPDILFVAAAGNDGTDNDTEAHYPSNFRAGNLISVASINSKGRLSRFSNFGRTSVDLAAPGEDIESTVPEGKMGLSSGTSMSAPDVTRVAAKIKFINPNLTPKRIIDILRASVTVTSSLQGTIKFSGYINEKQALTLASSLTKKR